MRPVECVPRTARRATPPGGQPHPRVLRTAPSHRPAPPPAAAASGASRETSGFETATGITARGRQVTVMADLGPGTSDAQRGDIEAAVKNALCGG